MNSPWFKACLAWLSKELRCELRSKHGLYSSMLFGFMAVIAVVFATAKQSFPPPIAAGFLIVVLVFIAVVTVPRLFLVEEDQRTFDLARLMAGPSAIFLGKTVFGTLLNSLGALVFSVLLVEMARIPVNHWGVLCLTAFLFAAATANCLAFCSALVIGAENRWILAGVVAMPLVLPLVFCGVNGVAYALGDGSWRMAQQNLLVLFGYSVAITSLAADFD